MKRKTKEVPGFDEIIFENRNREYGAYYLRKRYNSIAGLSILGASALTVALMLLLSIKSDDTIASAEPPRAVIIKPVPYIPPPRVEEPRAREPRKPREMIGNAAPRVVDRVDEESPGISSAARLLEITDPSGQADSLPAGYAQAPVDNLTDEPGDIPVIIAREMPEFPGGTAALYDFISRNIRYPAIPLTNNIEGMVTVKFVVKTDGSTGNIEILRSIDPYLDQEAVRVVSSLPRFRPGKNNGVPVPVWYIIPVLFKIEK
jgi:protein TonB